MYKFDPFAFELAEVDENSNSLNSSSPKGKAQ